MTKVLVAHDDVGMTRALVRAATDWGFESVTADSSRSAFAAATAENPDVILLNLKRPVTDTLAILSTLKAHPYTASVPVIILTTGDEPGDGQMCMEAGAFDFLGDRWSLDQLRQRVQAATSPRQSK